MLTPAGATVVVELLDEITRVQFLHIMGTDPTDETISTGMNDPVQGVSWYDAITLCNKLSLAEGKELVYSVNGITDWGVVEYGDIPTTSNLDWNAATMNVDANGYRLPTEAEWMWAAMGATHPVGTKPANALGLYDMDGNVWE